MATNNLPVVTVAQFSEIVKLQLSEKNYRPIFGLGKGGIGKTESIETLARRMNIGYIDIRLLLYAETDLKGIPYPDQSHTTTIWLQNNILPRADRDGNIGILVLDEITSVQRSVRTAAYQLLNERRLGEYKLPPNWLIVCLGNGEDDGGDFQGMEANFINRCSVFNVIPDVDTWKAWALQNNVNYLVTAYVSWRPSDLHTFNPDSETDVIFASPRSWKAVSDILNAHPFNKDDTLNNARIMANLGTTIGNNFIAFCKYKETTVEPADILAGKVRGFDSTSLEVLFLTMQGVVKMLSDMTNKDMQMTQKLSDSTMDCWANAVKWMLSLKSVEHQVMGLKDLIKSNQNIASHLFLNPQFNAKCPELRTFVMNNQNVLN